VVITATLSILALVGAGFLFSHFPGNDRRDSTHLSTSTPDDTPAPSLIVTAAAANTPESERMRANVLCSGGDDAAILQNAVDRLSSRRGTLRLLPGTYNLNRTVTVRDGVSVVGTGPDTVELHFSEPGWLDTFEGSTIEGVFLSGSGGIYTSDSGVSIRDTVITTDATHSAAFLVYASGEVLEGISFSNCTALRCGTTGFMNAGESSTRLIRDLQYRDCRAIDCGNEGPRFNDWVVGFDIAETAEIAGILVDGCLAEGSWESGFHIEDTMTVGAVEVSNCTSRNNGRKHGEHAPKYGAGYLVGASTIVRGSTSESNEVGYFCLNGSTLTGCVDAGSRTGYRVTDRSTIDIKNCVSSEPIEAALEAFNSTDIRCSGFTITDTENPSETPVRIGSGSYPSRNISIDLDLKGGTGDAAVTITNGEEIALSGTITTSARYPVMIAGESSRDIVVSSAWIATDADGGAGVVIASEVRQADSIEVRDTEIRSASVESSLVYGIQNSADHAVLVDNVMVMGARSSFLNCSKDIALSRTSLQVLFPVFSSQVGSSILTDLLRTFLNRLEFLTLFV
jgi:hypothetical protein